MTKSPGADLNPPGAVGMWFVPEPAESAGCPPRVYVSSLPSDKLLLTSLTVPPEGYSLCQCPYILLLSFLSSFCSSSSHAPAQC